MKTRLLSILAGLTITMGSAQTVLLQENFDDITTMTTWTMLNKSNPVGTTGWFQGNVAVFTSQAGAATSYIGANFNNTSGAGTISNWLVTPQLMLKDGDVIKFWTKNSSPTYPDRLEVRSSIGTSATLPSSATDTGSFTNLLLSVDPNLDGSYPTTWTEFTITISGVGGTPVAANVAFRYFVTNGGPSGDNSNYIGIDTFSVTRPSMGVSDVSKNKLTVYPNPTTDFLKINTSDKVSSVEIYDLTGKKASTKTDGNTIDVRNLRSGAYMIKVSYGDGNSISQKFIKK